MLGHVPTDPLLEIADALYALGPSEFTPARDVRAKELRSDDRALSERVKGLRKPSLAAWVVNLLVRREADQVDQLIAVGAALREAQAALDGEELRALTRQRRQLTAAVTTQARSWAGQAGQRVTEPVAEQVESTLTAAMLDAGAAAAVRSGLLVAALTATGVESVDVAPAVAVPEALGFSATPRSQPPPDLRVVPAAEVQSDGPPDRPDPAVRQRAEADLARAEEALAEATSRREAAAEVSAGLQARALQVQAEIDELRRRVADLETEADGVEEERADSDAELARLETAAAEAAAERDAARAALESL